MPSKPRLRLVGGTDYHPPVISLPVAKLPPREVPSDLVTAARQIAELQAIELPLGRGSGPTRAAVRRRIESRWDFIRSAAPRSLAEAVVKLRLCLEFPHRREAESYQDCLRQAVEFVETESKRRA